MTTTTQPRAYRDPGAWSGPLTALSFLAGVARANSPYPRPWAPPAEVSAYFTKNAVSAGLSATGQLASALSLLGFTRSVATLAARSGRGSRVLRASAIVGGGVAAASLATSAICTAALSGKRGRQQATAAPIARRGFAAGGPVHGVGFGLLCGALGVAGLRTGALPRPVAILAVASAPPGLLAPLYFVARPAGWLVPAGRFPGLIATALARSRMARA